MVSLCNKLHDTFCLLWEISFFVLRWLGIGLGLSQGFLQSHEVYIFGYARTKISDDELRDRIRGWDNYLWCMGYSYRAKTKCFTDSCCYFYWLEINSCKTLSTFRTSLPIAYFWWLRISYFHLYIDCLVTFFLFLLDVTTLMTPTQKYCDFDALASSLKQISVANAWNDSVRMMDWLAF